MRGVVAIVSGVVLLACHAQAQTPATVFLEDLTWTEVRDAVADGVTTVIVPTGGTEQNGPHMVLGKHNYLVKHKAGEVARRLGNTLVAPVMAYVPEGDVDPPTGHMRFPGTITTPPAVFELVLEFAARSFGQHGFLDIVLLGDSGGNQASQAAAAGRLNLEWADTPVRVHHLTDYYPGRGTRGSSSKVRRRRMWAPTRACTTRRASCFSTPRSCGSTRWTGAPAETATASPGTRAGRQPRMASRFSRCRSPMPCGRSGRCARAVGASSPW